MIIQLHDSEKHLHFAPLTLTRPLGALRCGILTNEERWKILVPGAGISFMTEEYLSEVYPTTPGDLLVNAAIIPDRKLALAILAIDVDASLYCKDLWIAKRGKGENVIQYEGEKPLVLTERWDIYQLNGQAMEMDYRLLTFGRTSQALPEGNTLIGPLENIFIEEGAVIHASVINLNSGPVYIGAHAEIMEGSLIRGPLALCESATLKMGAKVYGPTTIGPHCKVGGEVNNVVFQEFSNKGHDGFLGNSVIGAWCNLGADTNTSNLKNNYGTVKAWSYKTNKFEETGVTFMGLMMGDHSKAGINTMFNTGTVVGVCCNVFSGDFPPKFLPSFSWGIHGDKYTFDKALEDIHAMMSRRSKELDPAEKDFLQHLFKA